MTYGTLKQMVQRYLRSDAPDVVNSLGAWVNLAQLNICTRSRWKFTKVVDTITTVTGSIGPYSLTKPVVHLGKVLYSTLPLTYVEYDQRSIYLSLQSGPPRAFSLLSNLTQVEIYPTPSGSFQISFGYYSPLPDLSADTDRNYLTDTYPMALITGAVVEGLLYLGDSDGARLWNERFQSELQNILSREQEDYTAPKP